MKQVQQQPKKGILSSVLSLIGKAKSLVKNVNDAIKYVTLISDTIDFVQDRLKQIEDAK